MLYFNEHTPGNMCRKSLIILAVLCACGFTTSFSVNNESNRSASAEQTDEITPRNKVRHSRYPKLDDISRKITNLDSIIPTSIKDFIEEDEESEEIAKEDEEYEEYDDDNEDEEDEIYKNLLHLEDDKSQKLGEILDRYLMAADQWRSNKSEDIKNEEEIEEYDDYWEQEDQGTQPSHRDLHKQLAGRHWRFHGTRNQLVRPRHSLKRDELREATQHTIRMSREGICHTPLPRVVSIQSVHQHLSKTYMPHCTILHYCGDDTGCCNSDSLVCAPKSIDRIELAFYTTLIGQKGLNVEKLTFVNHTECECIQRSEYMKDAGTTNTPLFKNLQEPYLPITNTDTEEPMAFTKCRCPSEFNSQIKEDKKCICDCTGKQKDCLRLKRGKEFFGLRDRLCIHSDECQKPMCEFGSYIQKKGRCPRKQEKS